MLGLGEIVRITFHVNKRARFQLEGNSERFK